MAPFRKAFPIGAALATSLLLGWTACSSQPESSGLFNLRSAPVKPNGKRSAAPDFALKDIDGRTVHLSDYRGKVVLVDFWATWCPPCRLEIPWFMEFERKNKDRGFAVLGVAMDDDGWSAVKPFLKESSVNYRIILGDDKTADQYGGIEALPTTFLIDRDGRVALKHEGLASKKDFEDAIDKLLETTSAARRDGSSVLARALPSGADAEAYGGAAPAAQR